MELNEAQQILKDNGYLIEASKYDYEYELLKDYFPDAKDMDIHANRSIRSPLWKTLYGWECEFSLNGKHHWFTFGKGGCGFEPSLKGYIRKYCKLDSFDEDFLVCAKRELEEETGYKSNDIEFLCDTYTAASFCSEIVRIFVAKNLQNGKQHFDRDEELVAEEWTASDLKKEIFNGNIKDGKTIAGLMSYFTKIGG